MTRFCVISYTRRAKTARISGSHRTNGLGESHGVYIFDRREVSGGHARRTAPRKTRQYQSGANPTEARGGLGKLRSKALQTVPGRTLHELRQKKLMDSDVGRASTARRDEFDLPSDFSVDVLMRFRTIVADIAESEMPVVVEAA
jgi:hypothetical protein